MDRALQLGARDLVRERQRRADEALHVAGAAAIELVAAHFRRERIARPVLAIDRHNVGVARQDVAAVALGPERREEVGLVLLGIIAAAAARARVLQKLLREIDQREVRQPARRVEGDEALGEVERGHVQPSTWDAGLPMTLRNSRRVSGFLRNSPCIAEVTMLTPVLCTPRVVMHWCVASMTTATPLGSSTVWMQCAICAVI